MKKQPGYEISFYLEDSFLFRISSNKMPYLPIAGSEIQHNGRHYIVNKVVFDYHRTPKNADTLLPAVYLHRYF